MFSASRTEVIFTALIHSFNLFLISSYNVEDFDDLEDLKDSEDLKM